jgi:hypothetical protein
MNKFMRIAVLMFIPFSIPAGSSEVAEQDWTNAGLFHRQISNKSCSEHPSEELHRVPGYDFTYQKTDDCDFFYPSHTSLAMHVFYIEWINKFGDNGTLLRAFNELVVEYGTYQRKISRIYSIDGTYRPNPTIINGLTGNSGKYIFVWIGDSVEPRLHKNSFVHELVHVAIYAYSFGEHGDPDHEGDKYQGWTKQHTRFIVETNKVLESMDL